MKDVQAWLEARAYTPEILALARTVLEEIRTGVPVMDAVRRNPLPVSGHIAKHILVAAYRQMVADGEMDEDPALLARIRMKPMRTLSGVTTVTVLTKPYPCPGDCIFCPTDVRMPKSYLPDEPGAARAYQNNFDPHGQVLSRLEAYEAVGHPTDKIELLILGGTWSAYPHDYQAWFIQHCLDTMNGCDSTSLEEAQRINEDGAHRNVGLVIETRPDRITPAELAWLRFLGVTKVQLGIQSLDDEILKKNRRGHTVAQALRACALLRAAGFKIVLHWMPNLLGATPASDREDFARLWFEAESGLGLCPDEIKIYPTQLLEATVLHQHWQRGEYQPYTTEELVNMMADVKPGIPEYCRVNRIIRDIPSNHVVAGNRRTSLRQDVMAELERRGQHCRCVRCREVGGGQVRLKDLELKDLVYHPAYAEEHFLSFVTPEDRIVGYLRLSLPQPGGVDLAIPDLENAALIREVHVYGQALPVGMGQEGAAQHIGLGTRLLQRADEIARAAGFRRMAVISAIGTRKYYEARGFGRGQLYMVKDLGVSPE
jgi:elongator complex protein 3